MSTELDNKIEEMTEGIKALASELKDKSDIGLDRIQAIETEIASRDGQLEELLVAKRRVETEDRVKALEARMSDMRPASKAAAILKGTGDVALAQKSYGKYNEDNFLSALVDARKGIPDAQAFKAVLGTSNATGLSIVPNNFVAGLVEFAAAGNVYRQIMNVVTGVQGAGVDIPYDADEITAALKQGANGSNKDIRDFNFGEATATLYTIAQIADIGNQLLRQSNGAAEASARRRLGKSIGAAEAIYINSGTGSSQPVGILQAFTTTFNSNYITTLSSEPRGAALGRGIGALEARAHDSSGLAIVMSPTDFWEATVEGLGTAYAGGWAMDPTGGATVPRISLWGVPVYRDPYWPTASVGTAIVGDFAVCDMYLGQDYRIDVSSEGGSRFDQNVTGFRAEEEFGFNATAYYLTGHFQRVNGL